MCEVHDECCQTQTGRLTTSRELEPGPVGATNTRIMTMTRVVIYLVGCLGGPTRRLRRVLRRWETLRRNQPSPRKNDDHARRNVKVKKGATEEKCVAGPVVTRAQAKKSDKVNTLKVKEAMSSVDKSTIENLQRKDSTPKSVLIALGSRSLERTT